MKVYQRQTEYLNKEKNSDYLLLMYLKELINHFKVSFAFLKMQPRKIEIDDCLKNALILE